MNQSRLQDLPGREMFQAKSQKLVAQMLRTEGRFLEKKMRTLNSEGRPTHFWQKFIGKAIC